MSEDEENGGGASAPSGDDAPASPEPAASAAPETPAEAAPAPKVAAPEGPRPKLKPAQPMRDDLEGAEYMPRIPWGWIVGGIALVATLAIGYRMRDQARAEELRANLLTSHREQLADLPERYRAFREQLETWTIEAASAGEPERWVDPRLRISGLHGGAGIYLRILATEATTAEGIERGAMAMEEDALTRCLGIAPASARGLYASGNFLTEDFVEEIRTEPELIRLRVLDEMLASSMTSDVPVVSTLLQAEYFLLVVQQGETRRDSPVDVYLWDLGENRQLLRARFQARGVLLPVRIDSLLPGVAMPPDPPGRPSMTSAGATDCSIAAQIKGLTGESPVTITGEVADALRDADAEAEAAEAAAAAAAEAAEGAAPTEGTPTEGAPTEAAVPAAEGSAPTPSPEPSGTAP